MGKGAGQGHKERFLKAKMNLEAQVFGHHNFAKGGICRNGTESLTEISEGLGEKMLVVLFTASLLLCSFWKLTGVIIPSSYQGLEFLSPRAGIIWVTNWGKVICISYLFYSKTTEWGS